MRWRALIALALTLAAGFVLLPAAEEAATVDDMWSSAEAWAKENLDEEVLAVLDRVDRERVKQFLRELEKQLGGDSVVDLANLRDAARALLPLLKQHEETVGWALWIESRLDYLDVAEEFRQSTPPPKTEPGQPPKPVPNPSPAREREIWVRKLSARPWPKTAKAYVERLKPVFAAQRAPPELVWLAEVESSFNPKARSPSGAAGLFQLMPDTARRYGLRVGIFDQRSQPEASARAAACHLRDLHHRFGDWRLALAAYNSGEGTLRKLLGRQKAKSFEAIAPRLPAETQMFVPRVEAVLLRREGLTLNQLRAPSGRG
jgi:membrane-bound lytic murein transglycosylase D